MTGPSTDEIRELLLRSRTESKRHIEAIRKASPLTYECLQEELFQYVMKKFLLSGQCSPETEFDTLTEQSLARSMKISPELVAQFDRAKSCDGATSAMAKKVLLFLSIQRELGLELPAEESARIRTMEDFAWMVWHTLAEDPVWAARMDLSCVIR